MLSFTKGRPIAKVVGGRHNNKILGIVTDNIKQCCKKCSKKCEKRPCCGGCNMCFDKRGDIGDMLILKDGKLDPLLNIEERSVNYIAGPSGSGKSTYAANLMNNYKKIFPQKDIFIFSRADINSDPALKHLGAAQILVDENLIKNPIDITKELTGGSLLLFDDCNTIQDDKIKKAVIKLMDDIMEVGRKLDITIIITNHLVIPNERKSARTILNEAQYMTVFPKSGSSQQIHYCLKTYFGLPKKKIEEILSLPSRWITLIKNYPQTCIFENGAFLLN